MERATEIRETAFQLQLLRFKMFKTTERERVSAGEKHDLNTGSHRESMNIPLPHRIYGIHSTSSYTQIAQTLQKCENDAFMAIQRGYKEKEREMSWSNLVSTFCYLSLEGEFGQFLNGRRRESLLRVHPHTAEDNDDHGEDEEHAARHVDENVRVVILSLHLHRWHRAQEHSLDVCDDIMREMCCIIGETMNAVNASEATDAVGHMTMTSWWMQRIRTRIHTTIYRMYFLNGWEAIVFSKEVPTEESMRFLTAIDWDVLK